MFSVGGRGPILRRLRRDGAESSRTARLTVRASGLQPLRLPSTRSTMTQGSRLTGRVAAASLAAILIGCSATPATSEGEPTEVPSRTVASPGPSQAEASPTGTATPKATPTAADTPAATDERSCVDEVLASMSEAQRIGQVFMIGLVKDGLDAAERAAVADFHFGSFTFTTQSTAGIKSIHALTASVQALATEEATAGTRFFVAANQEGGLIQGLAGAGFDVIPSALDQGRMTVSALKQKAARWGSELRQAGINVDLAPVADVVP